MCHWFPLYFIVSDVLFQILNKDFCNSDNEATNSPHQLYKLNTLKVLSFHAMVPQKFKV